MTERNQESSAVDRFCDDLGRSLRGRTSSGHLVRTVRARIGKRTPDEMVQLHVFDTLRRMSVATAAVFVIVFSIAIAVSLETRSIEGGASTAETAQRAPVDLAPALEEEVLLEEYASESAIFAALLQEDFIR